MKATVIGTIATLVLLATVAMGQQLQTPFPQSANPSLANNQFNDNSQMANQDKAAAGITNDVTTTTALPGSPFPYIANGSRSETTDGERSVVTVQDHSDVPLSPFPASANTRK